MTIIDLHCDLLGCVEHEQRLHFDHPETCCSIPQLRAGGVKLQTLAIYALTGRGSTETAERQLSLYKKLLATYPTVASYRTFALSSDKLHTLLAIENASGLAEEDEPLENAFKRLDTLCAVERVLYIGLTWNQENRFGGGNASTVGLKRDGELILEYINDKGIAIDLAHTSDALAYDILNVIDKKNLKITPIASHSNFRAIKDIPRNLPNDLAREVIKRGGLIGINFVRRFVGDRPEDFLEHIHHGIALGGENALALGADFYGGLTIPAHLMPERSFPIFQPTFSNSSCYPAFLSLLATALSPQQVAKIAYSNAAHFLSNEG